MAGMLRQILEKQLTTDELAALGGAARCEGAVTSSELAYGAILAIVQGEPVPEAVQRKIDTEPAAKLEKERAETALEVLEEDANWSDMRHALEQLPPAALLSILLKEMTAEQMKTLAGRARCQGATRKAQYVYGVLLAVATRETGLKNLPVDAQRRIDATPVAADWIADLIRARLREDFEGNWKDFMAKLLERPRKEHPREQPTPRTGPGQTKPATKLASNGKKDIKKKLFDEAETGAASDATSTSAAAERLCDATGFWPALYAGTLALGVASDPYLKLLSPLAAFVGLVATHVYFR